MSTKNLASLLVCLCLSLYGGSIFAQYDGPASDYQYYFDKFDIEVVHNSAVEIEYPSWAAPNPAQDQTDLSYWVNDVLPYAEDRDEDAYLVYPKHGIVVPVLRPTADDQAQIDMGEMFNHYPYLEQGALHYYGYSPDEAISNMVIAAHSSFKKNSKGNYKTIFQALPISREGDKIFYYGKNSQGNYDFYEYTIAESFETDKYNVSILGYDGGQTPTLTTYGCYKIGSNQDRWINIAKLTDTRLSQSSTESVAARLSHSFQAEHAAPEEPPLSLASATEQVAPTKDTTVDTSQDSLRAVLRSRNAQTSTTHQAASIEPERTSRTYALPFVITYGNRLEKLAIHLMGKAKFKRENILDLATRIETKISDLESKDDPNQHKIDMYSYLLDKVHTYLD